MLGWKRFRVLKKNSECDVTSRGSRVTNRCRRVNMFLPELPGVQHIQLSLSHSFSRSLTNLSFSHIPQTLPAIFCHEMSSV